MSILCGYRECHLTAHGESKFTLLSLVLKPKENLQSQERPWPRWEQSARFPDFRIETTEGVAVQFCDFGSREVSFEVPGIALPF